MNKAEFLEKLSYSLQKMNNLEKNKFIIYYDEMISDYVENGMTEEDAVKKIGAPAKIAEELLDDYNNVKLNLPSNGSKVLKFIVTIIGFPLWGSVFLAFLLLILSIYVLLWCVPFVTGAGCVGYFATSIWGIIGTPFVMVKGISFGIIQLGTSIASMGISVLLGIATIDISKKFIRITKNFNIKLVALFKKKVVIQ